ncbi:MAG: glutathione S-transferase family protein [Sphingobium sp.]
MRMFWSPRSPFARKAMVVAHEAGLADRIEIIRIDIPQREPNPDLAAASPLQKLPTLVTDEGQTIIDSPVICEYLDGLGKAGLYPQGAERWRALSFQALGDELLTIMLQWRAELRRPEENRSAPLLANFAARLDRSLDWLEAQSWEAGPVTIGDITIGVMLSYLDFRFPEREWRKGRDRLARQQADREQRPSFIATPFGGQSSASIPGHQQS